MSDRRLLEPNRALAQTLAGLRNGQARTQNRQRWPGAIQHTVAEGTNSATSNGTLATLAAVNLEPGTWFVIARAGVQISSTAGSPLFSGTEVFTTSLKVHKRDIATPLETVDQDVWSPAVDSVTGTNVAYSQAIILFASFTFDFRTTVVLSGSSDDPVAADHTVTWRGGKIEALPF